MDNVASFAQYTGGMYFCLHIRCQREDAGSDNNESVCGNNLLPVFADGIKVGADLVKNVGASGGRTEDIVRIAVVIRSYTVISITA